MRRVIAGKRITSRWSALPKNYLNMINLQCNSSQRNRASLVAPFALSDVSPEDGTPGRSPSNGRPIPIIERRRDGRDSGWIGLVVDRTPTHQPPTVKIRPPQARASVAAAAMLTFDGRRRKAAGRSRAGVAVSPGPRRRRHHPGRGLKRDKAQGRAIDRGSDGEAKSVQTSLPLEETFGVDAFAARVTGSP